MTIHQPLDPYTYHVLQRMDEKVRASLTPTQLSAIREAIAASRPLKNHPVDIRGIIPVFFARYYFVLLLGRDRRASTRRMEEKRQWLTSLSGGLLLLFLGIAPVILLIMLLLYLIKCSFGIDIMGNFHLRDLLTFWK